MLGISNLVVGLLFTSVNLGIYLYLYNNYSLHLEPDNKLLSIVLAIVLYDFCYYINHWAHHKSGFLWCNHFVHHSGKSFNLNTAIRIGFIGNLTVWIFFLPMACIGVSLENYLIAISAQLVYQFLIHTILIPELGILEKVLVTPSQHRVHHGSNDTYLDKNFGCFFVIWDRFFGTYQRELKDVPVVYGVTTPIYQEYSHGQLNIFMYANLIKTVITKISWKEKFLTIFGNPRYIKISVNKDNCVFEQKTKNEIILSWIEYIVPIFTGLYLVLNFQNLSNVDSFILITIFLLNANLAGYELEQKWTKRKCMLYILGAQIVLGIYMIISYENFQVILFLQIVSCFIFLLMSFYLFIV